MFVEMERFGVELCPNCLAPLSPSNSAFRCESCHACFPVIDGIPVFARDWESNYGVMSGPELKQLLQLCTDKGWNKGVSVFLRHKPIGEADEWAGYFTPEKRAAGRLLLPANPLASVLDLGCGIGPICLNFARYARHVTAVDRGLGQLQLLRLRAKENKLDNLDVICAGDRQHLPFPEQSFDVVVLNGVLEWVGTSFDYGEPRVHQLDFLKDLHRVLKPGGEVYIGIENRYALNYFLGEPDEHTTLRFVTLLPRFVADILSTVRTGKPYRVYTYSRAGYRKLLRESGFSAVRFFLPRTNYRNISQFIPAGSHFEAMEATRKKPHLQSAQSRPIKAAAFPYLTHSYVMVAAKRELAPSLLEEAIEKLQFSLAARKMQSGDLDAGFVRVAESCVALVPAREQGVQKFMLRIPLQPQAGGSQRHNADFLACLADRLTPDSVIRPLLPEPLPALDCQGQPVLVESYLPGLDLRHCYHSADQPGVFRLGLDFLLSLHRELSSGRTHSRRAIAAWVAERTSHLYGTAGIPQGSLQPLVDDALACVENQALPVVCTHGDFWPGNLLATPTGERLTGVVDWKFADAEGFPLMDLSQFLWRTKGMASGKGFTEELLKRFQARRFEDDEKTWIDEYCDALGLSDRAVWALVFMTWLDWIYRRSDISSYLPSWRRNEITSFLQAADQVACSAVSGS